MRLPDRVIMYAIYCLQLRTVYELNVVIYYVVYYLSLITEGKRKHPYTEEWLTLLLFFVSCDLHIVQCVLCVCTIL